MEYLPLQCSWVITCGTPLGCMTVLSGSHILLWSTYCDRLVLKRCNICTSTEDRERVLLGLLTGSWTAVYLQEQNWLKDICITEVHPSMSDQAHQARNLKQFDRLGSVIPSQAAWRSFAFLVRLACLCIFQAAWLVWKSAARLIGVRSDSADLLLVCSCEMEKATVCAQFQVFPEGISSCFVLTKISCRINILSFHLLVNMIS